MKKNKIWIWEDANYPNFIYDTKEITPLLLETSRQQGLLEGTIKHLSKEEQSSIRREAILDEIVYNSSIEGEILLRASVRSSLRKNFEGFDDKKGDKHTDNIVSIQKDINNNYEPLTIKRLYHWHHELIINSEYDSTQVVAGEFRAYDEMYVTSGSGMRTKIHYQAPPARDIEKEINLFLEYCNNSKDDPIIKSAIAHIWFVQIHPFGDGNGRITRNITNHILSKTMGLDSRYFSISHVINSDLKNYGLILEETNKLSKNPNLDLTRWIKWHTLMISNAIELSIKLIDKTIRKTKFYDKIRDIKINHSQSKAINMLLAGQEEMINNNMYRVITGNNQVTASRHLNNLVEKGVLKKVPEQKGRSSAYQLDMHLVFNLDEDENR